MTAGLHAPIRGGESVAVDMSLHVGICYWVATCRDLREHMVVTWISSARTRSWNLQAVFYRQSSEVSCEPRVLPNPAEYTADPESLRVALGARQRRAPFADCKRH